MRTDPDLWNTIPMTRNLTARHQIIDLILELIAWTFVVLLTLYLWKLDYPEVHNRLNFTPVNLTFAITCFLLYIAGAIWRIFAKSTRYKGLILQCICLFILIYLFPNGILVILAIRLVANLNEYLPTYIVLLIALGIPLIYFLQIPGEFAWFNIILFSLFNLFALYASNRMLDERKAKQLNTDLLRELRATQSMLSTTARQDERLRIARDLHDGLGHHIAALSIQLEVAKQLSSDKAHPHICKAQGVAHQLLNDIQTAVSDIRQSHPLELHAALVALTQNLDRLEVQLNIAADLRITNTRTAEVIFRAAQEAITNVLKHSAADTCLLSLEQKEGQLLLSCEDNGPVLTPIKFGNGLMGMTERVQELNGNLTWVADNRGFKLRIEIPESI